MVELYIFISLFLFSLIFNFLLLYNKKLNKKLLNSISELDVIIRKSTCNIQELISENLKLKSDISQIKNSKEKIFRISKGCKVIHKADLSHKKLNSNFSVLYECDVLESTERNLKLKAFECTSEDDFVSQNKNMVIQYMQDKWIPISKCELVIQDQQIRDYKLDQLLD